MSDFPDSPAVELPAATPETVVIPDETALSDVESEPEQPSKTFTQDQLDEKIQARLAKESRKFERQANERAELQMRAERAEMRNAPQREFQAPRGEPQISQFQDYQSYNSALTDYKINQALERSQQASQQMSQQREMQDRASAVKTSMSKAAEKYDDFHEVALSNDVPISQAMAATIAESDKGGDIAYYLGSNISEAQRISRLSPVKQVQEIAKLEAKFTSPPVKATNAPEPTKPVSAGSSNMKNLENMSQADYVKARAKQGARWAR